MADPSDDEPGESGAAPAAESRLRRAGRAEARMARDMAGQAAQFIASAASVLEREVAAGIGAAQRLERRVTDPSRLRSRSPDEVVQRFRRDAHEVIDVLMDFVALAAESVEAAASRVVRIGEAPEPSLGSDPSAVPTLRPKAPSRPGGTVVVDMALENASDAPREVAGFQLSDLIAPSGDRIPADRIAYGPTPIVIQPHGKARVTLSVTVPPEARAGTYSGLILATRMEQVRALLAVTVEDGAEAENAAG